MLHTDKVLTITADNGKEFAGHKLTAALLECDCYFANPYASWERGLNENTNGLIRQYFPKKSNFNHLTEADIKEFKMLSTLDLENVLALKPLMISSKPLSLLR